MSRPRIESVSIDSDELVVVVSQKVMESDEKKDEINFFVYCPFFYGSTQP